MATVIVIDCVVATVLTPYSVALTAGSNHGVVNGAEVTVWETVSITDPETSEELGAVRIDKLRLVVSEVHEKFCVARVPASPVSFGVLSLAGPPRKKITSGASGAGRNDDEVVIRRGEPVTVYVPAQSP